MSILSLPTWFDVLECEIGLMPETRAFAGPFGGPTEVLDLLGDRWRMRITMPDGDFTWGGRTGALFNQLRGGANWLRMHDFARPVPRGTARGAITLASAAAQGAAALSLQGLLSSNWLQGSGFEVHVSGPATPWASYSTGTTGAITYGSSAAIAAGGFYSQRISALNLGTSTADTVGVYQTVNAASLAGQPVVFSATIAVYDGTPKASLYLTWRNGVTVLRSDASSVSPSATPGRYALAVTAPATATAVDVFIWMHSRTGSVGTAVIDIDAAQLELGTAASSYSGPATFGAGDKLGHNGEQLFEVADDVVASDAGVVTVPLTNRLRKAIASGQAIVWDKPQIPWQLVDNRGVPTVFTRGRARGQQAEFVEAWQG